MTALITNSFWTPIFALDRLNSWVRTGEDIEKQITASYLDCTECHEEDMRDKAEGEAMHELDVDSSDYDSECDLP